MRAELLLSLEAISHETTKMLATLDHHSELPASDLREARRRVLELRGRAQELMDAISEGWLEKAN